MDIHYQDFKIIFTVFLFWFSIQFGEIVEDAVAYFMVLSLGIIHGANDLLILEKNERNSKRLLKSIAGYLGLIVICVVSFFVSPFISLMVFIFISSYHFGEQQFEHKMGGSDWLNFSIYCIYGLLIFLMLFNENVADVDLIVFDLTGKVFSERIISIALVMTLILLIALFLFGFIKKYNFKMNIFKELGYLVLLYLVFRTTSLILGFAIYFIFWHSIPSIIDQTKYISGKVSKRSFLKYFKTASPIWIVSICALIGIYMYLDKRFFSSAIFLILFAVTVPHAWVMYRMKKNT